MKFDMLTGDLNWRKYGAQFVSPLLQYRDDTRSFPYYLVIDAIDSSTIQILVVAPSLVRPDALERALHMIGLDAASATDLQKVEALAAYGICAPVWNSDRSIRSGSRLMHAAHIQAEVIARHLDRFLAKTINRIGQSGWDFLRGQSFDEFFSTREKSE